ncbi:MAG: TlpA family protein disulfide reductase, partial [Bdellovibrionaceae bacterium]|nr:TlpA family protein disulfide reductase [Bdellovibrio sp.]
LNKYLIEKSRLELTVIKRISGEEISIPQINKNLILFFWAVDCANCRIEFIKLSRLAAQGKLRAESLIAINYKDDRATILDYMEKENLPFIIGQDLDGQLVKKFKITQVPTYIFVNKNSIVDWISIGSSVNLEEKISNFLIN